MTKAEMESHRDEYYALVAKAQTARQNGAHLQAIKSAVSSWVHIDGMMQYERKYDKTDLVHLEGVEIVLALAPYLLDFESLNQLDDLLRSQRRIEKNTSADLVENVAKARAMMRKAYDFWNFLECNSDFSQQLVNENRQRDQIDWRSIGKTWEEMGLIKRSTDEVSKDFVLATEMRAHCLAKCSSCGVVGKAAKAKFLEKMACPKCKTTAYFVILARDPNQNK
ncbi:MAG: hypothetical protein ACJ8FY_18525 [Gemmataceae bacterium]